MATTNTISGQLKRISDAALLIWNKASVAGGMGLSLPAGTYWDLTTKADASITGNDNWITGTNSPEASYNTSTGKVNYNFGIDAVAAAINAINVRPFLGVDSDNAYVSGNQELNENDVITIPVGYNKTQYTITANSVGSQLSDTSAVAKYLYKNKTAYVKGPDGTPTLITGSLANAYLYSPVGAPDAAKYNASNNLKVSINSDWATNKNLDPAELLDTNIPYRNPQASAPVPGSTRDDGTVGTLASTIASIDSYDVYKDGKIGKFLMVDLIPGYYDKNLYTNIAYVNDKYINDIKITKVTTPDGTSTIANTLTIPAGYYADGLVITPVFEDSDDQEENVMNVTNLIVSGELTFNANNQAVFTPGNQDASKAYDFYSGVAINKGAGSIAINSENKKIEFTVTTSGWFNKDETFASNLRELTPDQITANNANNSVITDRTFTITVDQGYYSGKDVTKNFTIRPGSHTQTALTDIFKYNNNKFEGSSAQTITVTVENQFGKFDHEITAGWLVDSPKTTSYFKIRDWARKGTTANTNDYYTVGTAGWIATDTFIGGSLFNPDTAGAGGTALPGYNKTTDVYNPNNAAADLVIPAGAVLVNPITVSKITSGTATYEITLADIANTDPNADVTKITISAGDDTDGTRSTYMTAVTVDMKIILDELQKI